MALAKDIIHKLTYDIAYADGNNAIDKIRILDETTNYFYANIFPVIESYLIEKCAQSNLFVEKLELDLGNVTEANFPDLLLDELDKWITEEMMNATGTQTYDSTSLSHNGQLSNSEPSINRANSQLTTEQEENAILYFITYGILPWYFQHQNVDFNKLFTKTFKTGSTRFINEFTALLRGNNNAIERFVFQFDRSNVTIFFRQIINNLAHRNKQIVTDWFDLILKIGATPYKQNSIALYQFILIESNFKKSTEDFISSFSYHVVARIDKHYLNKLLEFISRQGNEQEYLLKGWYQYIIENKPAIQNAEHIALLQFILSASANSTNEFKRSLVEYLINQIAQKHAYIVFNAVFNELKSRNKSILNAWAYFITYKIEDVSIVPITSLIKFIINKKHTEANSAKFIKAFTKEILIPHFSINKHSAGLIIDNLNAISTGNTTENLEKKYAVFFERLQNQLLSGSKSNGHEEKRSSSQKNPAKTQQSDSLKQPINNKETTSSPQKNPEKILPTNPMKFPNEETILPGNEAARERQQLADDVMSEHSKTKIRITNSDNELPGNDLKTNTQSNITDPSNESHKPNDDNEMHESFIINNAGLVLFFPFMPMFFRDLGFIEDGIFAVKQHQYKAAQILHYLATGSSNTLENLLVLNKLLVGLNINTPIPDNIKLTRKQKKSCNTLLESILAHWTALGNTSVRGLQGSFLLRDGVIKKDGDNWILYVERKGYDILLEKIPWSFGLIKFPWTKYFIHVQW